MPPRGLIALIALFAHVFFEGARVGPPRGRRTILWSATDHQDEDLIKTTEPEASREKPNECELFSHFLKTSVFGKASAASEIRALEFRGVSWTDGPDTLGLRGD